MISKRYRRVVLIIAFVLALAVSTQLGRAHFRSPFTLPTTPAVPPPAPEHDLAVEHSLTSSSFERNLRDIQAGKLEGYRLFESKTNGKGQGAGAWHQENAEPGYTCVHEERIGPYGDGGKWVCDPHKLRIKGSACLVYSVGSSDDFRFENDILQKVSSDCEIHVFDHTVPNPTTKPPAVHYHAYGLSVHSSGNLRTLKDIVNELGHAGRRIDIFKIDCEGCEWVTYNSWFEAPVTINEILVEVHAGTAEPSNNPPAKQFMQTMFDNEMLIFHKEPNIQFSGGDSLCVEYAFTRVSSDVVAAVPKLPNSEN
mmetsp:Transcript_23218/g.37231  ORF Transcript_23218/g.37231 Transcript_23218/m.37231 type:complete len:310 (+) Transcript_23218:142-1071(+)